MTPEEREAAIIFAQFMTNEKNQRYLMEQANRVPTNINVSTSDYPAISTVDFGLQLSATLEITGELPSPDFFIASQANLESYQNQKLIQDIALAVDRSNLLYLPKTVQALSVGESLYGLPQSIHLPALYYRPELVETPVNTFVGLLAQAKEGLKIAINADFYELFWGTGAFGCQLCQSGQLFNEQGEFALTKADLDPWLDWLEQAEKTNNVIFSTDQAALESLFLAGEVSYLVADVSFLNKAQSQLGLANVGVATLPFGEEEQAATPFMSIDSFFFHSETTQEQLKLALKFVTFASTQSSQILLMQQGNLIPTNRLAIVTAKDPDSLPFISKIDTSVLLPLQSKREIIAKSKLFDIYKKLSSKIKTD